MISSVSSLGLTVLSTLSPTNLNDGVRICNVGTDETSGTLFISEVEKVSVLEAVRVSGEKGGASISSDDASLEDCPIFSGVVKSTYKSGGTGNSLSEFI